MATESTRTLSVSKISSTGPCIDSLIEGNRALACLCHLMLIGHLLKGRQLVSTIPSLVVGCKWNTLSKWCAPRIGSLQQRSRIPGSMFPNLWVLHPILRAHNTWKGYHKFLSLLVMMRFLGPCSRNIQQLFCTHTLTWDSFDSQLHRPLIASAGQDCWV